MKKRGRRINGMGREEEIQPRRRETTSQTLVLEKENEETNSKQKRKMEKWKGESSGGDEVHKKEEFEVQKGE